MCVCLVCGFCVCGWFDGRSRIVLVLLLLLSFCSMGGREGCWYRFWKRLELGLFWFCLRGLLLLQIVVVVLVLVLLYFFLVFSCLISGATRESSNIHNLEYKFDKYGHMQCLMLILKQEEGHSGPPGVTFNAPAGHPVLSHARFGATRGALALLQARTSVLVPCSAAGRPSSQSAKV